MFGYAKTYAYDKNGNTISVTENGVTTTYTYFDFGKIRSIENDATKESYTYDHEGRRIRKESYTKATDVTESINYLLDDSGLVYNVLAEYDDTLHATTLYTYGTNIINIETNGETSYYVVDGTAFSEIVKEILYSKPYHAGVAIKKAVEKEAENSLPKSDEQSKEKQSEKKNQTEDIYEEDNGYDSNWEDECPRKSRIGKQRGNTPRSNQA